MTFLIWSVIIIIILYLIFTKFVLPIIIEFSKNAPRKYTGPTAFPIITPGEEYDQEITVDSESEEGTQYTINPHFMTCTCSDWRKRRDIYAANDIRRPCKHILKYLIDHSLLDSSDPLAVAYLMHGHAAHLEIGEGKGDNGMRVLLCRDPGGEWVDITTYLDGESASYGFNIRENRWSYGESPKGLARDIRRLIKEFRKLYDN